MQNKTSIIEILDSKTPEDALKIIDALSAEDIIQQDTTGASILHHLCFGREVEQLKFDLAPVIEKIVAKNPAILTLKWSDLKTPIEIAITENDLEAVKILAPYYAKAKLEVIARERMTLLAPRDDLGDNEIMSGEEAIDEIITETSALSYYLRHEQIEMLQVLYQEGFKELEGIKDLSKYNLANPTKENLQELYKDLFVAGKKEELAGLHRYLGYYEGHEGKNSEELIAALKDVNYEEALKLISQGHYVYDFSKFRNSYFGEPYLIIFFFLQALHHPNYNILVRDKDGNSPLFMAVYNGHKEIAGLIIEAAKENRIDLNILFAPDNKGNTPLLLAAWQDRTEMALAILEAANGNGIDLKTVFAPDNKGNTPLHFAAYKGHTEIAVLLIEAAKENRIDLNILFAPNIFGNTPLHSAARQDNNELVRVLLAHGACPSLNMLLNYTFSTEINSMLREAYKQKYPQSAYNAFSAVWNILEGAAQAMSGDITKFYDDQAKEAKAKKRDDIQKDKKIGRE